MITESELRLALESLADKLDLPVHSFTKDWQEETADPVEIESYFKLYDSLNNEDEKIVLMSMIIHAAHKLWESRGSQDDWDRLERRLIWDFGIHKHTIQKWVVQEDKSNRAKSEIASNMRELLNQNQLDKTRVLFVCTLNQMRSATAHHIYKNDLRFEVKSAGTHYRADTIISQDLLVWAELVFVMEKRHRSFIQRTYPEESNHKKIKCLDIPDDFDFMQAELITILRNKIEAFF